MTQIIVERESPRVPARRRSRTSKNGNLSAHGEPMLWLTGGALALCFLMILGLLGMVAAEGFRTFVPRPLYRLTLDDGSVVFGEVDRMETFRPTPEYLDEMPPEQRARAEAEMAASGGWLIRRRYRTGNFPLLKTHFTEVPDHRVLKVESPEWGVTIEAEVDGRFFGDVAGFEVDGARTTDDPAEAWKAYLSHRGEVQKLLDREHSLERAVVGPINRQLADARRRVRSAELAGGIESPATQAAQVEFDRLDVEASDRLARLREEIDALRAEANRYSLVLAASTDPAFVVPLSNIVRAYPANQLTTGDKFAIYGSRWKEFLTTNPREANSEGGVFPAIIGTLAMTMIMAVAVVPFGVLAALYLKEYAKEGFVVSVIRIAINNLAGVPSIVFGVFGLGFFVYFCGGNIDQAFFRAYDGPVFGQGGVLWASLTLALLTLPVVIVATEESLSAVPNSMREGSYACGASKWQTIRRIVLPRAMPGVLTGLILAISRGAGEVAPLMLVGVLEHAQELPLDGEFPFVHPERPIMHLGFSIYHSAFKSNNSEAAQPKVFTMTLLLIALIAILNLAAIALRSRLRRRYATGAF